MTYPGVEGEIAEWDILNEIVTNRTLEDAFKGTAGYTTGRELYTEIFDKARAVDESTGLWLNDYVTISTNQGPQSGQYQLLKQFTREVVDSEVDIEGLGFQGHIGLYPNGIPSVLATYDDFYESFGLKAKITEFDMPGNIGEDLGATYLRDFLTATFSHRSMNGFLFWGFWAEDSYMNHSGATLFRKDWSLSKPGQTFLDMVFDEWWTDVTMYSSQNGEANSRVFKGLFEISYTCEGLKTIDTLSITDPTEITIVCDNPTKLSLNLDQENSIRLFPNPTTGLLQINEIGMSPALIQVFNLHGKLLYQSKTNADNFTIDLSGLHGTLLVEVTTETKRMVKKVIVQK